MKHLPPIFSLFFLLPLLASGSPAEENSVIQLSDLAKSGEVLSLPIKEALPLYDTKHARRTLATLPAGQTLTVLAMDRFGLKIRGKGKNGPLTGWVSQKTAFQGSEQSLAALKQLYERQSQVEALIQQKQVAIGMSLPELTRIMGAPTNHHIVAGSGNSTETATWTKSKTVNLADGFSEPFADAGISPPVLEMQVETGRMTATLKKGVAHAIDSNFGVKGKQIPEIPAPTTAPFLLAKAVAR